MQESPDENQPKFEYFIDLLLEIFKKQKIEPLIVNGFDDWTQIAELQPKDLLEIEYSQEEAQQILQCVRRVALYSRENGSQQQIQKQEQQQKHLTIEKSIQKPVIEIPQFAQNPLTFQLLMKGTTMKPTTKANSNFLSTEKKITKICHLQEMKSLQILHLNNNCISKIEGLQNCRLIKTLRLDYNYISKIQGLQELQNLNKLFLNHNIISNLEGLDRLYSLSQLNISDQQIPSSLVLSKGVLENIGQSLQILFCNNNKIQNIQEFRNLRAVTILQMKNNRIKEVSAIADILPSMTRIKSIKFIGNPVVKASKYRDYLVILAKSLQQIDNKKILPSQRQYLVKLYSLKHAKQQSNDKEPLIKVPRKETPEITINKLEGQVGVAHKLNSPTDFHNDVVHRPSKKIPVNKH